MKKTPPDLNIVERIVGTMFDENSAVSLAYVQATQLGRSALENEVKTLLGAIDRFVPKYNDFDCDLFRKAITTLRHKIYTIRFGREYSPVVYIKPMINVVKNSDEKNFAIARNLMDALVSRLQPSECWIEEICHVVVGGRKDDELTKKKSYEIRLWFD